MKRSSRDRDVREISKLCNISSKHLQDSLACNRMKSTKGIKLVRFFNTLRILLNLIRISMSLSVTNWPALLVHCSRIVRFHLNNLPEQYFFNATIIFGRFNKSQFS